MINWEVISIERSPESKNRRGQAPTASNLERLPLRLLCKLDVGCLLAAAARIVFDVEGNLVAFIDA